MPRSSKLVPTVADALTALRLFGTAGEPISEVHSGPSPTAPLVGVARDTDAEPGDVSWISASALASDPGRAASFGGSFLILPPGGEAPSCGHAITESPRLIFSRLVPALFPHRLGTDWTDTSGAQIDSSARLAPGVVVGPGVVIEAGVTVGPNTTLSYTTLGRGVAVGPNCSLGADGFGYTRAAGGQLVPFPHLGRVVLADGVTVGANTCIDRGALGETHIGAGTRIDNLVHIAHNVRIGRDCAIIARAMIAGSVTVGDGAWIAPSASILNKVAVGAGATVGLGAVVIRDVPPGATVVGNPARELPRPD